MQSKAERTRQFIIEKTAPVFNAKGYAGTSITDLTTATGLTKGSIYGNFENKDEVALAAFDHNFGLVVQFIRGKMQEKSTVIEQLLVYPEIYRDFLELPMLKEGCPVLNTSTEADDTHPLLKAKAAEALQFWKNAVERLLQKGIENGEIDSRTHVPQFSAILMSLIEGAVMQAKVTGNSRDLHLAMDYLEAMIRQLQR